MFQKRIAVAIIGSAISIIGEKYFIGWMQYVSYAILVIIGFFSSTQKNALIYGALYGAALSLTSCFMMPGYAHYYYWHIITLGFFFIVGGSLLGVALTYIGYSIKVLTQKKDNSARK